MVYSPGIRLNFMISWVGHGAFLAHKIADFAHFRKFYLTYPEPTPRKDKKRTVTPRLLACGTSICGVITMLKWRHHVVSLRCGPWARHIYPSLVLVQPRKTRLCLTERLLMGRKESNQSNKQTNKCHHVTCMSHLTVFRIFWKPFSCFSNIKLGIKWWARKRIHHSCEDGIEKSVPSITNWHHEKSRRSVASQSLISCGLVAEDFTAKVFMKSVGNFSAAYLENLCN